ncbi:MAG: hypothetical protein JW704_12425 [Anaerolineaceae bacterium]|nr:hypothetical protein [Anaerolineaceae bacterium]MBN2677034.1 hypothetical protein [Anaerolineaceae bacterium]
MAIILLILFIISIVIGYFIVVFLRNKSRNNLETINQIRLLDENQSNIIHQLNLLLANIGYINIARSKLIIRFVFPGKDSDFIEKDYTFLISEINKLEEEQKPLLKDIKRELAKLPKNMSNEITDIVTQNARKEGIIEILIFIEGILSTLIIGLIINLIRISSG